MTVIPPIAAAQYLRMSTEHQQYSTENQARCIEQYAQAHGFTVTHTYCDSAKSGLWLKGRPSLRELLRDVTEGNTDYRAVLVYDVSRWGRFQDTDEAAHYEFVCKSAGIPVHYCAETFANDGSLPSSIMKALKRAMAGEYSRELSVKVLAGQKRLAELGFWQGGTSGYGFQRLLVSLERKPKQLLALGERKSIASDRVILVPGADDEVKQVQDIYRLFTIEKLGVKAIARDLNRREIPSPQNRKWGHSVVAKILSNPKYVGCNVYSQTTKRLGGPWLARPRADWVIIPGAFKGIIEPKTFALAQEIRASRTVSKTDEQLLQDLRSLLTVKGRVSNKIINESVEMPDSRTFWYRFGGLRRACELIGYDCSKNGRKTDEEMLQDLRSLLREKGRLSKRIIDTVPRVTSSCKLKWRFGTLGRAYELIGYDWKKNMSRARRTR